MALDQKMRDFSLCVYNNSAKRHGGNLIILVPQHTMYSLRQLEDNATKRSVKQQLWNEHQAREEIEKELAAVFSGVYHFVQSCQMGRNLPLPSKPPPTSLQKSLPGSAGCRLCFSTGERRWLEGLGSTKSSCEGPDQAPFSWWRSSADLDLLFDVPPLRTNLL